MSNSDYPRIGASFERDVFRWFSNNYPQAFEMGKAIPIGDPAKLHKFDIVDDRKSIAVECKCYKWTETGNVPSAKMGFCNEAAFYLSFLPDTYAKYIVMLYSIHSKREETLAEYYFRMNRHLLGNIVVAEFNPETETMRIVGCNKTGI